MWLSIIHYFLLNLNLKLFQLTNGSSFKLVDVIDVDLRFNVFFLSFF